MIVTGAQKEHTLSQRVWKRVVQAGEQVASCPLGQMIFRGAHQVLWTVETSVKWFEDPNTSVDQSAIGQDPPQQPVRPLPWILFLPLLVYLRILKFAVNLIASLQGKEPIQPAQVVSFLQNRRRHLRALKYQGLKNFRSWKLKENQTHKIGESEGLLLKICTRGPIAKLVTFTGLDRMVSILRRQKTPSQVKDRNANSLPDDDSSDENDDVIAKINRMCRDFSSEEDPDYEPSDDTDEYTSSDDNELQGEYEGAQHSIQHLSQTISKILACTQLLADTDESCVNHQSEAGTSCNPKALFLALDAKNEAPQEELDSLKVEAGPSHNIDENVKEEKINENLDMTLCQSIEDISDTKSTTESSADVTTDTDGDMTTDTTLEDSRQEGNDDYNESSSTMSLESAGACSEDTSQTYYSPIGSSLATPEPIGQDVSKFIFHEQVSESESLQDQTFHSIESTTIEENTGDAFEPQSQLHSEKSTINTIAEPDQQSAESSKFIRSISDPSNMCGEPAETLNSLKQSNSAASLATFKKSGFIESKTSLKNDDEIQKGKGRLSSFFNIKKKS